MRLLAIALPAILLVGCAMAVGRSDILANPSQKAAASAEVAAATRSATSSTVDVAAAATSILPRTAASPAQVIRNLDFVVPAGCAAAACSVQLDVFVPSGAGPFPTVVLVRGGPTGPGGRGYVEPFAEQLAAAGILVFNADMRDVASTGGGYPEAFDDVACAIRYARTWSADYGGNANTVTLVGHSLGGYVGSVVALDPQQFTGDCLAGGNGKPDAFVGLSGNYDLSTPSVAADMVEFFGGSPVDTASQRDAGDPFLFDDAAPIPVFLVSGESDHTVPSPVAEEMYQFLDGLGWDVDLTLVADGTHQSILDADAYGATSVRIVEDATAAAAA